MPGIESLLRGRVLGERYRIEDVIGRGGMGAVYRSTDERLGRRVAVKVITVTGGSDPQARERIRARFLREARAAAALPHHPNVVPVYDYGTDAELGLDFLVMELLQGEDLATRMGRGEQVPLTNGIWILHEAARGVAVGHRAGLIHRDVKPGNIFLARSGHGDEVQVRVLDFGIAKLIADEDTLTQLTQDGRVPLSPAFAAPEQLRGLSKLNPASDVFSLGAVGFQLLTGARPFSDADRNRISLGMPVPVPSLRAYNPAVPSAVDETIRRALAYEPTERFSDAAEFASVLAQVRREMGDVPLAPYAPASSAPAPARPATHGFDDRTEFMEDDRTLLDPELEGRASPRPGADPPRRPATPPPGRTLPPRRRHQEERRGMGWMVATLVLLILLGAAGVFAWFMMQEAPPEQIADEIPAAPDTLPTILPEQPLEDPTEPTELDALVYNQEGGRLFRAGDYGGALEQFRAAVEISPGNAEYRNNYGFTLFRLGMVEEAADQLSRAIRSDPNRAVAYANLADARAALGDTIAAIAALEQFLNLSDDARQRAIASRRLRELQASQEPAVADPDEEPARPDTLLRDSPAR
ncbi:MAG: protein kinase [Gemmatimonadetes bacterium]|nr:protein kinase [Gemmatimonadota bacterium]